VNQVCGNQCWYQAAIQSNARCVVEILFVLCGIAGTSAVFGQSSHGAEPVRVNQLVAIPVQGNFAGADNDLTTRYADMTEQAELEQCLSSVEGAPVPYSLPRYRRELFPWLERATLPNRIGGWLDLARNSDVANLSATLGVRYWLLWNVSDSHAPSHGGILCGAGPGGGGCFGLTWMERKSNYQGVLIDVQRARIVEYPVANVTGTTTIPAFILPVPMVAPTHALACRDMAGTIAAAIRAEKPPR
jgi:hypothetical protein